MKEKRKNIEIIDKNNIFNDEWWDTFIKETKNLTQTTVFKNCLTKQDTKEMRNFLVEILRDLSELRTNQYGYRVYEDGVILDDTEMNRIYDSPPLKNEPLEEWVKRTFGNKKFGMIINEGERFNMELSRKMALRTKPLFNKIGFPKEGVNFSIFIGNYGWTPLGIHQDSAGESVIHFHLGPGPKTMYTWNDEEFRELVNVRTYDNHNIQPLLKYANEFKFEEGDLYFMPTGEFHIGHSDKLSLSVTLWQYNHTKFRFARRIHNMIIDQFIKNSEELVTPDTNELNDISGMTDVLSTFEFTDEMNNFSYEELLTDMYRDLRYSIHSNAGYRTSPFPKLDKDSVINMEDMLILNTPFKILYRESNDKKKLYIYTRGNKLSLNNFKCMCDVIDKINTGVVLKASSLLELLDSSWSDDIGLNFLGIIYQNHGIIKNN